MRVIKSTHAKTTIIPHGVDDRFISRPRAQLPICQYSNERPYRILYVSTIDVYKHQWHAAAAVARLRAKGVPVVLDLVGTAYPPALRRLRKDMFRLDLTGDFIRYLGAERYEDLNRRYLEADLFLFASSCETFGQILTEAMSAGLPIACSKLSAMPEILGDAGVYFNPEDPEDIVHALSKLIDSPNLRGKLAQASFERAHAYSWTRCGNETFKFLLEIAGTKTNCRQSSI